MGSPQQMAPDLEEILHNAVDRGEPLEMSDRLEAGIWRSRCRVRSCETSARLLAY
jgi:hypothetical protein